MTKIRTILRRNVAVLAVAATLSALGLGGVVAAQAADNNSAGNSTDHGCGQVSDGDGETNDDANGTEKSDGDGEQNDATEVEGDGETDDDATDQGPDADPNEPGHQDASDQ